MRARFSPMFLHLLPAVIIVSALMGAWVAYVSHSQRMSYARYVNASK